MANSINSVTLEGMKPFKCFAYNCTSSHNGFIEQPVATVHVGKKPFQCKLCGHSFSRKAVMKQHVDTVHKGKKPFKCDLCDYTSSQKNHIKQHIASATGCEHPAILLSNLASMHFLFFVYTQFFD